MKAHLEVTLRNIERECHSRGMDLSEYFFRSKDIQDCIDFARTQYQMTIPEIQWSCYLAINNLKF